MKHVDSVHFSVDTGFGVRPAVALWCVELSGHLTYAHEFRTNTFSLSLLHTTHSLSLLLQSRSRPVSTRSISLSHAHSDWGIRFHVIRSGICVVLFTVRVHALAVAGAAWWLRAYRHRLHSDYTWNANKCLRRRCALDSRHFYMIHLINAQNDKFMRRPMPS